MKPFKLSNWKLIMSGDQEMLIISGYEMAVVVWNREFD